MPPHIQLPTTREHKAANQRQYPRPHPPNAVDTYKIKKATRTPLAPRKTGQRGLQVPYDTIQQLYGRVDQWEAEKENLGKAPYKKTDIYKDMGMGDHTAQMILARRKTQGDLNSEVQEVRNMEVDSLYRRRPY